jgi:hypothetical protein
MGTGQQQRRTRATGKGQKQDSPGLSVSVDGKTYTVRESDLTAHDARALRLETGMSWRGLLDVASKDFDIDLLAALVWLARRLEGETDLAYEQVLDEVGYDSDLEINVDDQRTASPETGGSPEA